MWRWNRVTSTSIVASHADVLRGCSRVPATRDEPLRTSAWEATSIPDTVEALVTDTLVSGQLYVRPPPQNLVLTSTETMYFYIPLSGQFP